MLELPTVGEIPVALAEHLLCMKVLSMTERRLKDRMDALALLEHNPGLDLVRRLLALVAARGFDRGEPLGEKLEGLLASREQG
jgi:hypothetical protein